MTFLIVDDTTCFRVALKDMIIELGHSVVGEASNGEEAIKKAKELNPEFITMDLDMPKVNGVDATKKICEEIPSCKIIICTSICEQRMIINCIKAGAKDFITKPLSITRMKKALMNLSKND